MGDFVYRDSSEKAAGFTFEGGFMNENRDRSTNLAETQDRVTDQLDQECRNTVKSMINRMEAQLDAQLGDRDHMIEQANKSFERACNLYPEFEEQLNNQIEAINQEFTNRICQMELIWQRTAGSSLNTLVQQHKNKAEVELARQLSEVLGTALQRFREHETQALQQAFQKEFIAHYQQGQIVFGHIANMLGIMKGAQTVDDFDRGVNENVNETVNQIRAMGNYFRSAKSIAAVSGEHEGDVDELAAIANGVR